MVPSMCPLLWSDHNNLDPPQEKAILCHPKEELWENSTLLGFNNSLHTMQNSTLQRDSTCSKVCTENIPNRGCQYLFASLTPPSLCSPRWGVSVPAKAIYLKEENRNPKWVRVVQCTITSRGNLKIKSHFTSLLSPQGGEQSWANPNVDMSKWHPLKPSSQLLDGHLHCSK